MKSPWCHPTCCNRGHHHPCPHRLYALPRQNSASTVCTSSPHRFLPARRRLWYAGCLPGHTDIPSNRPREFYCWLHGWNNTHHGTTCKIMGANTAYTPTMKSATGPTNTGGNPKVGVPVHLHRSHFTFACSRPPCVLCLPSIPPFSPQTPPTPSPASSSAKQCVLLHEATRARPAILATLLLKQAEGPLSCPQDDTRSRPTNIVVSLSEQSEGHTHQPYEDTKASSAR
jgi:hypothetical protein